MQFSFIDCSLDNAQRRKAETGIFFPLWCKFAGKKCRMFYSCFISCLFLVCLSSFITISVVDVEKVVFTALVIVPTYKRPEFQTFQIVLQKKGFATLRKVTRAYATR